MHIKSIKVILNVEHTLCDNEQLQNLVQISKHRHSTKRYSKYKQDMK